MKPRFLNPVRACRLAHFQAAIVVALVCCCVMQALACRYSVRDTGFVDLGEENYSLILAGFRDNGSAKAFRTSAASSFLESNIQLQLREPRGEPAATISMRDVSGRELVLASGNSIPTRQPDIDAFLETVADSPLRAEIQDSALRHFAVVVMIDGQSDAANDRVETMTRQAIQHVASIMPSMPKPIRTPPILLRIPLARQGGEKIALWGLGFDPSPSADPRVAVVFGRGRRLGATMEGPLITRTALQEHLAIIGQDCECELDRAWMKGPLLPGKWAVDRQRDAARALGFDPENPMVRTEISRIVHRGPGAGPRKKMAGGALKLAYSESTLDTAEDSTEQTEPVAESRTEAPVSARSPEQGSATGPDRTAAGGGISWVAWFAGGGAVLSLAAWWWIKVGKDRG